MRRILAAWFTASLLMATTAAAMSPALETFLKVPWSLGIYLMQWTTKDTKKVLYVEVMTDGSDFESARQSAFRMAVERAVGVIVSSETEVNDQRIRRDEITTYASGFVHDYKLVDQTQRGSRTWIKMQVWVSHNHLRDRLLNESRDAGRVEGGRISEQIQSFQHSRTSGDRLLSMVLADYPQRAFNVTLDATRVTMDERRQARLHVPFSVAWNSVYVRSMAEAVTAINQRPDCLRWLANCYTTGMVHVGRQASAYFDDRVVYDMLHQELVISRPTVRMTVQDSVGSTLLTRCFSVAELDHSNYAPWYFVDVGPGYVTLNIHSSKRYEITLELGGLPVKNMDRVDVRIVRGSQCLS